MKNTNYQGRNFIKKATVSAVGMAIGGVASGMSARSYSRTISANDRINIAIAGLGRRLGAFLEPVTRQGNNIRLIYFCDVMESQRQKAAERFSEVIDYKPSSENDIRKVIDDRATGKTGISALQKPGTKGRMSWTSHVGRLFDL